MFHRRHTALIPLLQCSKINVKKIAFGNREHTTDKKMGVSVLLRNLNAHNASTNETNIIYFFLQFATEVARGWAPDL